uniref:Uncharacterized protein n=1 Tax=Rousettus aegyptiacus TaxID=9407 RepID=A0A7J8C2D3_ROUAE|nr:hypothetical protein HJG63_009316 [Rousettus aegyptiacus]
MYLTNSYIALNHMPSLIHIFAHLILIMSVLLASPSYRRGNQGTSPSFRRGNQGTEKLSSLPKVSQLVKPGFEPRHPGYRVWTPDHLGQCWLLLCYAAFPSKKISSFSLLTKCQGMCLTVFILKTSA